jgi:hypothetical protein
MEASGGLETCSVAQSKMEVMQMSSELSINSVAANPASVNPQVKTDQAAAAPQANQNAQQSVEKAKTDTVTVSEAALHKTSNAEAAATTTAQANQSTPQSADKTKTDKVTVSKAASQMASKTVTAAKLTGSALARSLKQQGMPLSQIALKMGLSADAAARLLGIQVANAAVQAAPTAKTSPVQ